MDNIESIKLINDLVIRTEKGELQWEKTEYSNHFKLKNSNGEIQISKKSSRDIHFKILGSKGAIIADNIFESGNNQDLQLYKISHVLWQLVKDLTRENSVDLGEIMSLLEEEDGEKTVDLDLKEEE